MRDFEFELIGFFGVLVWFRFCLLGRYLTEIEEGDLDIE